MSLDGSQGLGLGRGPGPGLSDDPLDDPVFKCQWPPHSLPVEIFQAILSYLTREDSKRMRLVNKDFDEKVSSFFFHSVVVPFTADIYTPNLKAGINHGYAQLASAKMNQGLRIFQSFGQHIKRFALSLELDEATLALPPPKPAQKAVPTFWGIYRWPHDSYARYMQFEDLEDTADQLQLLKQALLCLTDVRQLALCCDPGLGYLNGPERNIFFCPGPQPVFGLRDAGYRDSQSFARRNMSWKRLDEPMPLDSSAQKHAAIAAMMVRAGVAPKQADAGVDLLLRTEDVLLSNINLEGPRHATSGNSEQNRHFLDSCSTIKVPYKPNLLTPAQKEILLEFDWAVRALIESYTIAIGDLSRNGHFTHLRQLTIAKIPSSHLDPFKRHQFWDSLPFLKEVSLVVQPDWRTVAKKSPSSLESSSISPLSRVPEVYELLSVYLGRRENIKTLHFEWICGGEFAVGANSRDRFILPAPFCSPANMIQHDIALHPDRYISLPHVQHLSLKNCFSSPYLLMQVVRDMARQSLVTLELESFSLTGRPKHSDGTASAQEHRIFGADTLFSWPGFLEHFTPVARLLDTVFEHERANAISFCYNDRDKSLLRAPVSRHESRSQGYKLRNLLFKSCGYVNIPGDNTHISKGVSPLEPAAVRTASLRDLDLGVYLQTCKEGLWGHLASGLDPRESQILREHFGMHLGWEGVYEEWFARAALADRGNAGVCRFTGSLVKAAVRSESSYHPDSKMLGI